MKSTEHIRVTPSLIVEQSGERRVFPVAGGSVTSKAMDDGTGDYILDVTVPRFVDGQDFRPSEPGDLLSCCGGTARVEWLLESPAGSETVLSPLFVLDSWESGTVEITLTGRGRSSLVWEHVNATAIQSTPGMLVRELIRDIYAGDNLKIRISDGVPATVLPVEWIASTDRFETVKSLLEVLPGVIRETVNGIELLPALSVPVKADYRLADGDNGTVVTVPDSWERADRPNHVVVRGPGADDGPDVVAEDYVRSGPFAPEHYGWVSVEIDNDAVGSVEHARMVARAELEKRARYSRVVNVQTVTDWNVRLDDAVLVETADVTVLGRVVGVEIPVTGLGEMTIEVGAG